MISLFHKIGRLKDIKRAGWVRVGIQEPESVADHTYRCAFMVMILSDMFEMDYEKLLKMALLHDIAEIKTGDITPYDNISFEDRKEREHRAITEIFNNSPHSQIYIDLLREYTEQKSVEAKLVKNIDKLEMALTAVEYQNKHHDLNLTEFLDEAERQIKIPEISDLFKKLRKRGKATLQ